MRSLTAVCPPRLSTERIEQIKQTTNAIATCAATDAALRDHLKVEVVTDITEQSVQFITPAVQGYTLERYIDDPDRFDESTEHLSAKLDDMVSVLQRLAQHGFVHGDVHPGNLMYEPATGRFVLIDFERAQDFRTASGEHGEALRSAHKADLENLADAHGELRGVLEERDLGRG